MRRARLALLFVPMEATMMKSYHILNLCSGHKTWFRAWGDTPHIIRTVELNPKLDADLHADIADLSIDDLFALFPSPRIDVVIASPPCECFSVASIGAHWGGGSRAYEPKTERAKKAIRLVKHIVKLIEQSKAKYWWVENPVGVLRKLSIIPEAWNHSVIWYCKYGDSRAKPTDLWGSWPSTFTPRKPCKNHRFDKNGVRISNHCNHTSARRGAKTGTQGLKGAARRSFIPLELSNDVREALE